MKRPHFRFEDLDIWQLGKELSVLFHKVADNLEQRKLYRYAEQIRAAGLSVPNNPHGLLPQRSMKMHL